MANTHSLDLERSSSQYASIADGSQTGLDISTDFTFEAWINLEQLPSTAVDDFVIFGKDDVGVSRAYGLFIRSADDRLNVIYVDGSDNVTRIQMDEAFVGGDVGNWIHVAVTVDISAGTATFYKNGSSKADTVAVANATTINNSTTSFAVGMRMESSSATKFFDGLVDEIRVWNDIRTGGEISSNYDVEILGSEAGLVGYWQFNNDYLDQTSNNNDLTATGSPVFSTSVPFSIISFVPRVIFI